MSPAGVGPDAERVAYRLVEDERGLAEAVSVLESELDPSSPGPQPLYVDTEFESGRQGIRLCLLQLSLGPSIFLIDALRLHDLSPLGALLGRPNLLWVLHAGLQDLRLIEQEVGAAPRQLLDTQVAWALLGPEYSVSLAYLEYKVRGIRADKGHQADDWVRRPIPRSQLDYAAQDVAHLPAIFSHIRGHLLDLQRLDIAVAASLATLSPEPEPPRALAIGSFRNAWQLSPEGLTALASLIDLYNGLTPDDQGAIGEPKVLMSLSARMPKSKDDLVRIKGVNRSLAERHGARILDLVRRAREHGPTERAVLEPPAYGSFEEHRLDAWITTLRAEVCTTLSVAPELALPSRLTRRMLDAYAVGGISALAGSLNGWRKGLLEAEVQRFCERRPPPV
jgi:ribonuclease D